MKKKLRAHKSRSLNIPIITQPPMPAELISRKDPQSDPTVRSYGSDFIPAKVTKPRQLRFLRQTAPGGPFEPVGEWQDFAAVQVGLADHIAHNLPVHYLVGEPRYWIRGSGHDGFCEAR